MPLYELTNEIIKPVETTRFAEAGLRERADFQRILREQIEVVCPDTLVVAEDFGQWEESRRRIGLLGVDQNANLVVIELKRTEDGGDMDLQSIRYAAMVSTLTFERVVEIFAEHLAQMGNSGDARTMLLDHSNWESSEDREFAPSVRIVLVSADFSKELTTSVLWLNEQDLDLRCVRMTPYRLKDSLLVDVQQVVPLPEASEYMVPDSRETDGGPARHPVPNQIPHNFQHWSPLIERLVPSFGSKSQEEFREIPLLTPSSIPT